MTTYVGIEFDDADGGGIAKLKRKSAEDTSDIQTDKDEEDNCKIGRRRPPKKFANYDDDYYDDSFNENIQQNRNVKCNATGINLARPPTVVYLPESKGGFNNLLHNKKQELRKKWQILRTGYRTRRGEKYLPSGSGAKPIKKWVYFDSLMFLEPYMTERNTSTNLKKVSNNTTNRSLCNNVSSQSYAKAYMLNDIQTDKDEEDNCKIGRRRPPKKFANYDDDYYDDSFNENIQQNRNVKCNATGINLARPPTVVYLPESKGGFNNLLHNKKSQTTVEHVNKAAVSLNHR
ncbi:hypothetical protein FQA39_LY10029 [Lamprigera yunnana]|nr:hypothetical protein FQA39_LY10029 [Lamprigera yunnana]